MSIAISSSIAPSSAVRPAIVQRITSIDIARGAVMVLMAIDHVRVYAGVPAGGPSPAVFFTRWVTHFCAPAFVFFAGTSAYLAGRRRSRAELSRDLLVRGAWLVLLELTVLRVAWTFNLRFGEYDLLGVIWMIGWCMALMSALVWLPAPAVGAIGLAIVFGQNAIGAAAAATLPASLARIVYFGGVFRAGAGGPSIAVLYSIVPWIGVMAAGYGFGAVIVLDAPQRRRACLLIGASATAAFLIVGGLMVLTTPQARIAPPALLRLLNQRKYPASQLFLMMTLGPTIALLPAAERARSAAAHALAVFGRVPLFYYVLHIPTIHAAAMVVSLARSGRVDPWLFGNHPMLPPPVPAGYMWSLPLLYAVFAVVVALLYLPCAWFARVKARRPGGLLRYL